MDRYVRATFVGVSTQDVADRRVPEFTAWIPTTGITVPPGFVDSDDSDDEAQVHPMARRLFPGRTPAEVFAKAQQWVGEHEVRLVDVALRKPRGAVRFSGSYLPAHTSSVDFSQSHWQRCASCLSRHPV